MKNLHILIFRRKTAVQFIESSDSEEIETIELPQKMRGNRNVFDLICVL